MKSKLNYDKTANVQLTSLPKPWRFYTSAACDACDISRHITAGQKTSITMRLLKKSKHDDEDEDEDEDEDDFNDLFQTILWN